MIVFLSKLVWFLLAPLNLIVLAMAAGLALWRWKRTAAWGRRVVIGAGLTLIALAVLPVGPVALSVLERRFPPYRPCAGQPVAGILLLGGGLQSTTSHGRVVEELNSAADRMRYAAQLARDNPALPVLISGGQVFTRPGARSEAEGMADLLVELGVARARIRLESASRTTAQNAEMTAKLAATTPGAWLLVTSAYHMPRSMGLFRKAGVHVAAAPTDWNVDDDAPLILSSASGHIGQFEVAMREYVGLAFAWVTGKSADLLPGPGPASCPAA